MVRIEGIADAGLQHDAVASRLQPPRLITSEGTGKWYFVCKRLIDRILSALLLVVLAPLLLLITALIKLESPGRALFVQERVGSRRKSVDGRMLWEVCTFRCYKFRSMMADADSSLHRAYIKSFTSGRTPGGVNGTTFKLKQDPRVTRVGRVLRKTSLDELPQLLNILKGEMSFVGPRPVPDYEVAEYKEAHFERLAATPGITGLWQVKGRAVVSFEEMIRMDVEYVRARSMWLDLKILVFTIPAVISGRGAE